MATASTSGQSPFGLGRRRKAPGLLDQIGKFFGIDKKKRGKGSFRGHLSSSPQRPLHSSSRRRGDDNVVVHFFRSFVSSSPVQGQGGTLSPRRHVQQRACDRPQKTQRPDQHTLPNLQPGRESVPLPPKRWSTIF